MNLTSRLDVMYPYNLFEVKIGDVYGIQRGNETFTPFCFGVQG